MYTQAPPPSCLICGCRHRHHYLSFNPVKLPSPNSAPSPQPRPQSETLCGREHLEPPWSNGVGYPCHIYHLGLMVLETPVSSASTLQPQPSSPNLRSQTQPSSLNPPASTLQAQPSRSRPPLPDQAFLQLADSIEQLTWNPATGRPRKLEALAVENLDERAQGCATSVPNNTEPSLTH